MKDGRPWLGPHKTLRGVVAGVAAGGLGGWLMGFPVTVGLACGVLSMAGDLLASFVKRRLGRPSGAVIVGLDQLPESALPLLVMAPYAGLGPAAALALVLLFSVGAYAGSFLLTTMVMKRAVNRYRRNLRPHRRLHEWLACDMAYHPLHAFFNLQRVLFYDLLMKSAFRAMRLYGRGRQNALAIRRVEATLAFEDLPAAFDGYSILFLTDLHLDGLAGLNEQIMALVAPLQVDLCLFGGDYRTNVSGPFSKVLIRMGRLVRTIHARDGIYAVLGNHDCTEMVPPLEKRGVTFLVNDAVALRQGTDRLWLVGIDDPHYYRTHDLAQAFATVPDQAFSIVLAHAPEAYGEAAAYGARLYLCGHTHAGQVQLPRFGPVVTHCRAPRQYTQGHWRYGRMQGFTSAGVGVSGLPVRFGTLGEVVLIRLKRDTSPPVQRPAPRLSQTAGEAPSPDHA